MAGILVGYSRVSSRGQSLEAQVNLLEEYGCDRIFSEKASAGEGRERPELAALKSFVRLGDTVVITKLDRLARSLLDAANLISFFDDKGVALVVLGNPELNVDSKEGRLMRNIVLAMAEFERELISARCKDGIGAALERGVKFGTPERISRETILAIRERSTANGESISALLKEYGVNRDTYYRKLKVILGGKLDGSEWEAGARCRANWSEFKKHNK